MLTVHDTERLANLANLVQSYAIELDALLTMPRGEYLTGDLALLDLPEYIHSLSEQVNNLAFTLVQVQGRIEEFQRRVNVVQAGDSQSLYPSRPREHRGVG